MKGVLASRARWALLCADNRKVLAALPGASVDALITDPPAGISFMSKDWDGDKGGRDEWVAWLAGVMRECLRVLKPGAHALVWALPRTSHWTATALEDAGFEVRDVVMHLFGTGFPKSLDVSKALDKAAGAKREVLEWRKSAGGRTTAANPMDRDAGRTNTHDPITAPATPAAKQWEGWGTALKPAAEHWILCRKPLAGTVAKNVQAYSTGGLNIDGCRVDASEGKPVFSRSGGEQGSTYGAGLRNSNRTGETTTQGRWPANLTLDTEAAAMLDAQSAPQMHSAGRARDGSTAQVAESYDASAYELGPNRNMRRLGDSGGASRFFYVAKPSRKERGAGNTHPTVKPVALMRWLARLVTPPGGLVLDPFAGSGTTGVAALAEGFRFLGVEAVEEYAAMARARLKADKPQPAQLPLLEESHA